MTKCQLDELKEWLTKVFGYKNFEGGIWGGTLLRLFIWRRWGGISLGD
jgi:hypothetical protein